MKRRKQLTVSTFLLALSYVGDGKTLKCTGSTEILTNIVRSRAVRTGTTIQVVRELGRASGTDCFVRGTDETVRISTRVTLF